ncbi:deoxyribodipyrimidine photo-lyase-like [Hyla sarda]|uniref:deoxyribodipyrimidine photo-lyase-like n=1 Tax=Hyla sarda TaxID=327740 RepID=UPI0024C2F049|nr:deoxyribodipyrimidine photo-lyase-like [Hyla sarda]XP_056421481.1 deoxyribodipyrimidine photo-lyase-like [Hyla sarda]XP_056421482.1 deoxyribodipyrimidine photo-lyase-like [Hyla sarda]XP_056421483.1 deoxyribodipyrimidine photo-lyase-like [Hyla sarda]XP_056421484.1 deoxyribodipyrimidine photo-lyase-like [Hyla sarda]
MSQKAKPPKGKGEVSGNENSDAGQENDSKKKSLTASKSQGKRKPQENKSKSKAISEASSSETSDVDAKKRKMQDVGGDLSEAVKKFRSSVGTSVSEFKFNKKRVRLVSAEADLEDDALGIVYWMSRDQRVEDNWAFLYAQRLALKQKLPLHVVFCLVPKFLEATIRHYGFMLKGLQEVAEDCKSLNIPFHLLTGYAKDVLPDFVKQHGIGGVVTDFAPLRVPLQWVSDVCERLPKDVPLVQVDAHNIVPCWVASNKQEYGARTIRRKIHDQLSQFLTEFPPVITHPYTSKLEAEPIDWDKCYASLEVDRTVKEVEWAKPGSKAGINMLHSFITERLKYFNTDRNNPNRQALSNLSPWFHFGQLSVQRAILEVQKYRSKYKESVDSFVEEAVVRRELADNFCYYNKNYDKVEGAYDWAKNTLKDHAKDKRTHLYTLEKLESGKTHDLLWNAAQLQMVHEGKMHGFMRMYWAKKILEWTSSPEEALRIAIYLNDRFELDGRDPNGYVGCMWSICGIHDQGWAERAVFGKIRYMNYQGCKRKFDVDQFERRYHPKKFSS